MDEIGTSLRASVGIRALVALPGRRIPQQKAAGVRCWTPKVLTPNPGSERMAITVERLGMIVAGEQRQAKSGATFETIDPSNSRPLAVVRSEEHTSELQSQFHLVCRLLLEKKKMKKK